MPSPLTSANSSTFRKTSLNTMYKVPGSLLIKDVPDPPDYFDEEGILWWNYYCGLFVEGNMFSRYFLTCITNLCIQHQIRACLIQAVQDDGVMMDVLTAHKDGSISSKRIMNPAAKELQDTLMKMSKLLADCGLTVYTAKVNNFDSTGDITKDKQAGPPPISLPFPENSQVG